MLAFFAPRNNPNLRRERLPQRQWRYFTVTPSLTASQIAETQ
jgi:hypothetical protein